MRSSHVLMRLADFVRFILCTILPIRAIADICFMFLDRLRKGDADTLISAYKQHAPKVHPLKFVSVSAHSLPVSVFSFADSVLHLQLARRTKNV